MDIRSRAAGATLPYPYDAEARLGCKGSLGKNWYIFSRMGKRNKFKR